MDQDVALGLKKVFEQNSRAVLITICNVWGSTPRKPGAKMLVSADGMTVGTIGGGCGEAEARREALNVLASGTSKLFRLQMTADVAEDEGMVCGGTMELFLEYIDSQATFEAGELNPEQFYLKYLAALENQELTMMLTILAATDQQLIGKKMFRTMNGKTYGSLGGERLDRFAAERAQESEKLAKPSLLNLDSELEPAAGPSALSGLSLGSNASYRLLLEPASAKVKLIILGAGHIALPLAMMADILGYEITVVDDRPSFANPVRFSCADKVICRDFAGALDSLTISPQTFVTIITRGHRYDKVCLRKVIDKPAAYIGMIGSRRRVGALKEELVNEGVPRELLQRLHSPIGLDIGAETPEEIAVCILGEIIKVQKGLG